MARVLILTASYGSGHNEAARCLAAAVSAHGAEPLVVDYFRTCVHPLFDRLSRRFYDALLRRAPAVWGLAYELGDRMASDSWMTFGASRIGTPALGRLLARVAPDAVLTVHATPALAMASLAEDGRPVPPHVTVVTDFVAHSQWIASGIDHYCVAADEVAREFAARGIPRARIHVTGVPVREAFASPVDGAAARRALGLRDDAPVVLAMAGSWAGLGRMPDVASALLATRWPVQGLLVAGRDRRLEERLRRLTDGSRLRVYGYVDDVRRMMAAADLLVTKAGGMTLAEAMAAETPLLVFGSLPGQEERNERFASRAGVALVARNRRQLARLLDTALADTGLLDALRERMRAYRRPEAAQAVVALVVRRLAGRG
ncbi:MAG TPA: glycosyltransferase [Methylomirabilota bacterium]|jgi:processive 1,2-diacylglycerol beta-glucosyltransferase|nr:glycosyltransferase [Methylomirabilota bacterium]